MSQITNWSGRFLFTLGLNRVRVKFDCHTVTVSSFLSVPLNHWNVNINECQIYPILTVGAYLNLCLYFHQSKVFQSPCEKCTVIDSKQLWPNLAVDSQEVALLMAEVLFFFKLFYSLCFMHDDWGHENHSFFFITVWMYFIVNWCDLCLISLACVPKSVLQQDLI